MEVFKVLFEGNNPVSATLIGMSYFDEGNEDLLNEDGSIRWLPVLGNNARDSIDIVRKIVEDLL